MQFTIELANEIFRNSYAILNNVDTSLLEVEVLFPIVPVGHVTSLGLDIFHFES